MPVQRCQWSWKDPIYYPYHDKEWGTPVHDDKIMFEFLILEAFQAGLSWLTMLRKRENFRKAFHDFDYHKIARYTDKDVERLMNDSGIIRNKLKILGAISNAKAFLQVQKEFGSFCKYFWAFTDGKTIHNGYRNISEVPATTELSDKISKDLKKRGFKFMGSTIVYAHMQAVGLVNDHTVDCFRYPQLAENSADSEK